MGSELEADSLRSAIDKILSAILDHTKDKSETETCEVEDTSFCSAIYGSGVRGKCGGASLRNGSVLFVGLLQG